MISAPVHDLKQPILIYQEIKNKKVPTVILGYRVLFTLCLPLLLVNLYVILITDSFIKYLIKPFGTFTPSLSLYFGGCIIAVLQIT